MDEYIDIVDAKGKATGKSALKSIIHQNGFYHNTVHIWFYTSDGSILLAQRSLKKTICPLLWDVSVAGHVDAGEPIIKAAIRETKEEINLSITKTDLRKLGVFECFNSYPNGIIDNEFHHTYSCKLPVSITKLKPQQDEVEALKLVSIGDFKKLINTIEKDNYHFIASNKTYYTTVLKHIIEVLK